MSKSMSVSSKVDELSESERSESDVVRWDMLDKSNSSLEKCSILGGKVRLDMCSPLSILVLALNRMFIYLLANLAAGPEVGHKIVESLAESAKELYQGINEESLLSKHLVLFLKVLHFKRKCFSSSISPLEQYLQTRSSKGIGLGLRHLPVSNAK